VPILEKKETIVLPIKCILHPTDFSQRAEYAFKLACSLARDHGAKLVLLHVIPLPAAAYGDTLTGVAVQSYMEQAKEAMGKIVIPDPKLSVERRMVEGDAVQGILDCAKEVKADLIVLGTHGRTGLGRLLMGSVAEQVLRKAACPVLTIKQPFPQS
jgi:nucleotide-binding universal stress UspA family protein